MKAVTDWSDKGTNRYTHNEGGFLSLIRRLNSPSTLSSSLWLWHNTQTHMHAHTPKTDKSSTEAGTQETSNRDKTECDTEKRGGTPLTHRPYHKNTYFSWRTELSCSRVVDFLEYLTNQQLCYFQEWEVSYKENFYSYINALEQCFPQEQV